MKIDDILALMPDKTEDRTTTSKKFKSDLYEFFKREEFSDKTCLEIGCKNGYTTLILTHIFKLVYGINYDTVVSHTKFLKDNNRNNFELFAQDVYKFGLPVKNVDVIFVDAVHTHAAVMSDVHNSLNLHSIGKKYFIFDDVGLYPEVKSAVDELIRSEKLSLIRSIGHSPFSSGFSGLMNDYEGVICIER